MSHTSKTSTEAATVQPGPSRPASPGDTWTARWAARPLLAPLAVAVLTTVIALVNVTRVSLWVDEAYTLTVATRSLPDLWRMIANIDIVHSLYNALLHPWFAVVGVSEVSVRLPSAVAAGAAAAGVVVLTRRLTDPAAGLAAGLLFAVLPRVTWMGIEGRAYALTALVAVWLTILLVSLLDRPTWAKHVGYAVLAAFGCSLNIFLVLLLGAHGIALLCVRRVRFRRVFWTWLAAASAGVAGGLPVLLTAISQSAQIGENRAGVLGYLRQVFVNQWFLGGAPTIYLSGSGAVLDGPGSQLWKPAAVLLAAVAWALIAYAVLRPANDRGPIDYRVLLVSWLVVPTVALVGYSLVGSPLYNPRYLTYGAPAVAALLGIAVTRLGRLPGRRAVSGGVAVGLIVLLALPVYASQRGEYAKSGADWQRVAAFVAARPGPDQAVYFAPRVPPDGEVATITSRTAQILYPDAFAGLRDLTLLSTPAQDADLLGRSRLIQDSVDRLEGIRTVFTVNRYDYPADLLAADEAVLTRQGFRPGDSWTGPLNRVVVYTR